MWVDERLQVIISTPVPGAEETIIIGHEDGAAEDVHKWLEEHTDAEADTLAYNIMAIEIDQTALPGALSCPAITRATLDEPGEALRIQTLQLLTDAVQDARAITARIAD